MPLLAVGINHKTAPVNIRERVAFAPERMQQALHELVDAGVLPEAVAEQARKEVVQSVLNLPRHAVS